ncbi:MAG: DUF3800 domain-containing protein [Burkholderiales bacterium]
MFRLVRQHRTLLKNDYGIYIRKEIHAQKFVSGRGHVSSQTLGKWQRSRVFLGLLKLIARLPNVFLINVCLSVPGRSNPQIEAWDRLLNRIERTMVAFEERELPLRRTLASDAGASLPADRAHQLGIRLSAYAPRALIFADQGRELEITRAMRKMSIFNPIPSQLGAWGAGQPTKNIPIERVIEDPIFKSSHQSFFIQLADCAAFALLKRETALTPHVQRYGIHGMFEEALAGVCYRGASRYDPLGIVRK